MYRFPFEVNLLLEPPGSPPRRRGLPSACKARDMARPRQAAAFALAPGVLPLAAVPRTAEGGGEDAIVRWAAAGRARKLQGRLWASCPPTRGPAPILSPALPRKTRPLESPPW